MEGSSLGRAQLCAFVCAAALALGLAGAGLAQVAQPETPVHLTIAQASLLKAEDALLEADVTRELAVIKRGFADEANIVHANGMIQTRADYMRSTEEAKYPIRSINTDLRVVRIFGNVGVVRGNKNFVIDLVPGKGSHLSATYLAVYLKRDGRWQLLELHQIGASRNPGSK